MRAREVRGLKLIRGGRGSGKTTLLHLLYEELLCSAGRANVRIIDAGSFDEFKRAFDTSDDFFFHPRSFFLVDDIDESREKTDFILYLARFFNASIYATCRSSSFVTDRSGTSVCINFFPLYPLSFSEYRECSIFRYLGTTELYDVFKKSLNDIAVIGKNHSEQVYFSVCLDRIGEIKNYIKREKGIARSLTESILILIACNIGRILSVDDISFKMRMEKRLVKDILSSLEDMNIIASITGYDEKNDEFLTDGRKYYMTDNYFLKHLSQCDDNPMMLENMVAIELLRRSDSLYYGIEADFIAFSDYEKEIYQVVNRGEDINSRLEALRDIKAEYRYIISEEIETEMKGDVNAVNALCFLLKR